jgi:hypothetical protein
VKKDENKQYLKTANGNLVCVGNFDDNGFNVNNNWDDNVNDNLGVVRVWNFFSIYFKPLW